jgi:hypothetical protein
MPAVKAREGDLIETIEGLIFDVKGLVHPPDRIVAYLRYLENPRGDRRRGGKSYVKVYSLRERERVLRERYPEYIYYDPVFGDYMQGVPHRRVSRVYVPTEKVAELSRRASLDPVEADAFGFIQILRDLSGVELEKMGISGSILVGLHTADSDIDVIVYGRKNCLSVHAALAQTMEERSSPIRRYGLNDLMRLYEFRSKDTHMPLEEFIRMERRKFMQGKYAGRDFFMRFLYDWDDLDEEYGDRVYISSGYSKIRARVTDDSDSIFTPCRYLIDDVRTLEGTEATPLREIVSFRGRFCEQARNGEIVVAQGKLEKVIEKDGTEFFRLILGAKPSDFMISRPP